MATMVRTKLCASLYFEPEFTLDFTPDFTLDFTLQNRKAATARVYAPIREIFERKS